MSEFTDLLRRAADEFCDGPYAGFGEESRHSELLSAAADDLDHLAALLDGVLADDAAAIRDAAAWLAANRPEVDG